MLLPSMLAMPRPAHAPAAVAFRSLTETIFSAGLHPLADVLFAPEPHPDLAAELALFGQFVGSWDLVVVNHRPDGTIQRASGEWYFGWVLEGRAIQDVWISPRRSERTAGAAPGDYGATLRFFDPSIGAWRSTWIGPVNAAVRPFIARPVGDEIVLSGSFKPGVDVRWIFSHITARRFRWRAEESTDQWRSRRLLQEMLAVRMSGGSAEDLEEDPAFAVSARSLAAT
jgi:hypothetical protein